MANHNGVKFIDYSQVQAGDSVTRKIDRVAVILQVIAKIRGNIRIIFNN